MAPRTDPERAERLGARPADPRPPRAAREAGSRPPGEATQILTRALRERLLARPLRPWRRGSRRVALALYVVLLVLPTAVLGGLHWHQLRIDHEALTAAVPGGAADAARRLQEALQARVEELLAREDERPFYEYRAAYFPPGTIGAELAFVPSPLSVGPTPHAIRAWFSWPTEEDGAPGDPPVMLGSRAHEPNAARTRTQAAAVVRELKHRTALEDFETRTMRPGPMREENVAVPIVAINVSDEQDVDCLRSELGALVGLQNVTQAVSVSPFRLRSWQEADGQTHVVAMRTVQIPPHNSGAKLPSCFASFGRGLLLRQGFVVDNQWLFHELPGFLAEQVLGTTQRYLPPGAEDPAHGAEVFTILPLRSLAVELAEGQDDTAGALRVAVDARDLEQRFQTQGLRFLGVAAMLVLSLSTGLVLLLRSVTRDLEAAQRTENFVAAVTHELRTPVAAIKLYGEMLEAGWVDSEARKSEYYARIVRETGRLETLVERVLEKAQLARREAQAAPGDLNNVLEGLAPALTALAPPGVLDLEFELAPELPQVMLVPEGVRSIATNLVENARKYAPVAAGGEPIRVVTKRVGDGVVLEVADRGPGIPVAERERIFEAFYRMGDERTRTARGTGIGLHLVALHVQAMGAQVEALARQGGGTVFRVTLRVAPEGPPEAG